MESSLNDCGLFDAGKVQRLIKKLGTTNNSSEVENMALLGILSTQLIHQQFIKNFPHKKIAKIMPKVQIDRRSNNL